LEEQLWGKENVREEKKGKRIPCRHIPDTQQTFELVTPPATPLTLPTSRDQTPLYNQGNIRTKDRKRERERYVYRFDSTCKCSAPLDQFRLEMPGSNHHIAIGMGRLQYG
jgi:hypothetical protein